MKNLLGTMSLLTLISCSSVSQNAVAKDCIVEGAKELQTRVHKHTKDEKEIMELERQFCRDFLNGNVTASLKAGVAKHGMIFYEGAGIANSQKEQIAGFDYWLKQGNKIIFEPVDAQVSSSKDMAWAIGMTKHTKPDGSVDYGKYVSIWQKYDGKWKNVIEMRNTNNGAKLRPLPTK